MKEEKRILHDIKTCEICKSYYKEILEKTRKIKNKKIRGELLKL